jgi:RNA polymerase sigma factor (sigma-70 family)
MTKLTTDEIVTMCEKLARKYRRPHMNDDLVSEGVLAVYERLEVKPEEYPASLYRRANKAMYDYINRRSRVVHIPYTRTAESLSKGVEYKHGTYSEKGKKELARALSATSVNFDDAFSLSVQDCTQKYETKDFLSKAFKLLNDIDAEIIHKRYFNEMKQEEVAAECGMSQQAVFKREVAALNKMSRL